LSAENRLQETRRLLGSMSPTGPMGHARSRSMYMASGVLFIISVVVLAAGCASTDRAVQRGDDKAPVETTRTIELAPSDTLVLLEKARDYQGNRDYANALISIVRAERANGNGALGHEISQTKNELIENLHARALNESVAVEPGKGSDVPLEYMVFYMEGDIIYPAFNMPVFFEVKKGKAQITEKMFTNTNGVAACEVIRVDALEEEGVLITAGVFLDIEGEIFTIHKLNRDFTLHHRGLRAQTISFVVYESNIDRVESNSASGRRIEHFFIENGFSVSHGIGERDEELFMRAAGGDASALHVYGDRLESGLIAFTYIESVFSSKVSEGFYFAKSRIILDIVDTSTRRVVFNSVIEDVKGAGSTEEKAGRKAITEATDSFIDKLKGEMQGIELSVSAR
jgi:hypothetical protein